MDKAQDISTGSAQDKFGAVWVSHTSMSDFMSCPRAYYIKNIYKDPKTGRKVKLMSPPLALGSAVHEVLESLSQLPKEVRFQESLVDRLDKSWEKISGEKGGFASVSQEEQYKQRGRDMMLRVTTHKGPLSNPAVKIQMDLPNFWLSEKDNIILCGKLDWLEYLPDIDSVHIIDFKTGAHDESGDSLQLPIYYLLTQNCQKRPVVKASYWYLDRQDEPQEQPLPDTATSMERVYKIAKEVKLARSLKRFKCRYGGCRHCNQMEKVVEGKAKFVGIDEFGRDTYILPEEVKSTEDTSVIL